MVTCPICLNADGAQCEQLASDGFDGSEFQCTTCGRYKVTGSLYAGQLDPEGSTLSPLQRAVLSHHLRRSEQANGAAPTLNSYGFEEVLKDPKLPTPIQQATNAIRYVGDYERRTGQYLDGLQPGIQAIVGSFSLARACELFKELLDHKLVRVKDERRAKEANDFARCALTFAGWERYEDERKGSVSGTCGFIAMKFGNDALEAFVKDVVKPAVGSLGFDLIDMRDAAEAGIIDNILRVKIRDAAFLLVDLTHDNSGAYWEAGYAEGIGKPVVYLCEREKFESMGTHFDTNHLTTVPWEAARAEDFRLRLVATLRNTLKLFD
jgi:hypothetical protein